MKIKKIVKGLVTAAISLAMLAITHNATVNAAPPEPEELKFTILATESQIRHGQIIATIGKTTFPLPLSEDNIKKIFEKGSSIVTLTEIPIEILEKDSRTATLKEIPIKITIVLKPDPYLVNYKGKKYYMIFEKNPHRITYSNIIYTINYAKGYYTNIFGSKLYNFDKIDDPQVKINALEKAIRCIDEATQTLNTTKNLTTSDVDEKYIRNPIILSEFKNEDRKVLNARLDKLNMQRYKVLEKLAEAYKAKLEQQQMIEQLKQQNKQMAEKLEQNAAHEVPQPQPQQTEKPKNSSWFGWLKF